MLKNAWPEARKVIKQFLNYLENSVGGLMTAEFIDLRDNMTISISDFLKVLWKELQVSILLGVVLSAVNFVRLLVMYPGSGLIALTGALTIFATVGGMLPWWQKSFALTRRVWPPR